MAPIGIRGGFGDHVTGLATTAAVLAALHERHSTGRGQVLDSSLLRSGMYCLGWDLGIQLVLGRVAPASARESSFTPLVNSYQSSDGRWFFLIGLEADRHWPGALRALGREDLADDERFVSSRARLKAREELIAEFDRVFGTRPLAEWAERFNDNDVWWAPVNTPAEIVVDEQAIAAGALVEVEGAAGAGLFAAIAPPVTFVELRPGPVPGLGEHTAEVLAEVGLSADEIDVTAVPTATNVATVSTPGAADQDDAADPDDAAEDATRASWSSP